MNGHENLIPLNKRSKEVQREIQEQGRAANKAKWEQIMDARLQAKAFLEMPLKDSSGNVIRDQEGKPMTIRGGVLWKLIRAALNGNVRAAETVLKIAGEMQDPKVVANFPSVTFLLGEPQDAVIVEDDEKQG